MVKTPDGKGSFQAVNDISQVIKLAGRIGRIDPVEDFGFEEKFLNALDITTILAISAGLEALRDAGIPLVKTQVKTSTGKVIGGEWALPESMQEDTGIIFASAFPGYDSLVNELTQYFESKAEQFRIEQNRTIFDQLLNSVSNEEAKKELQRWIEENKSRLFEQQVPAYQFSREFLFKILAMGHAQFAQMIKARGPNTQINAACASTSQAFGIAEDWLRNSRCRRVIIITADNAASEKLLPWIGSGFLAAGGASTKDKVEEAALPFGQGRHGLVIGAAASAFVLETNDAYEERGVKPIAVLLGTHYVNSAYHGSRLNIDHIAEQLDKFITRMERTHGISRQEFAENGMFVSHETYTPARGGSAEAEIAALDTAFREHARKITIINTKGFTGHPMGAGVEEAIAIKAMEKGVVPPIYNYDKIDPVLKDYNFSKGLHKRLEYALRFAAGFGSQLAFVLFKLHTPSNRFTKQYKAWLGKIGGSQSQLFKQGRVLKMKRHSRANGSKEPIAEEKPKRILKDIVTARAKETENHKTLEDVLAVIAEISGYEKNDIDPDFDLEEDLGIDTVKQAEIFAALQKQLNLEESALESLADFNTPRKIAEAIRNNDKSSEPVETESIAESVELKIRKVIAELTGYEPELIEDHMDLEEDLGIDTVKQAEILAEIRQIFDLSEDIAFDPEELSSVKQIARFVSKHINLTTIETQNLTTLELEITNRLKKIIANQTGYEEADLDPRFDLEEDLGIDTVKQAEILAEIQNVWPDARIEDFEPERLRTIQSIAEALLGQQDLNKEHHGMRPTKPIPDKDDQTTSIREEVVKQVYRIISEITGYEEKDLDEKFDLEADLGIDTVKQAEIWSELQETFPNLDFEELDYSESLTLGDIISVLYEKMSLHERETPSKQSLPVSFTYKQESEEQSLEDQVKAVISEVTGYDMTDLELNMLLEEDLGIDTVKQAEILGSIQQRFSIQESEFDAIELNTIGEIVSLIRNHVHLEQDPIAASIEENTQEKPASRTEGNLVKARKLVEVKKIPTQETNIGLDDPVLLLYLAKKPPTTLTKKLAKKIPDLRVRKIGVRAIKSSPLDTRYVILFVDEGENHPDLHETFKDLFQYFHSQISALENLKPTIVVWIPSSKQEALETPLSRGTSAFVKSLGKEYSLRVETIATEGPEIVVNELLEPMSGHDVLIQQDRKMILMEAPLPLDHKKSIQLDKTDLIIATGGGKGITFACLKALVEKTPAQVAVIGRSKLSDNWEELADITEEQIQEQEREIKKELKSSKKKISPIQIKREVDRFRNSIMLAKNLKTLQGLVPRMHYYSADVSDENQVRKTIASITADFPESRILLIHGAGIEESKQFSKKTWERSAKIVSVKVKGIEYLLKAIDNERLIKVICFGSVAGVYGNTGQGDYAFANGVLGGYSTKLASHGIPALTINWSAWDEIGMATKGSIATLLQQAGVELLKVNEATQAFVSLAGSDVNGECVVARSLGIMTPALPEIMEKNRRSQDLANIFDSIEETDAKREATRELHPLNDRFMNHHRIQGTPFLPGVVGLEFMASIAGNGQRPRIIQEVRFRRAIKITREEAIRVKVTYDKKRGEASIKPLKHRKNKLSQQDVPYFSARFETSYKAISSEAQNKPPEEIKKIKSQVLTQIDSNKTPFTREKIYEMLFHGPAFQVLDRIVSIDEIQAIGIIRYPTDLEIGKPDSKWMPISNPVAIEAGFQLAGLIGALFANVSILPSSIGKITYHSNDQLEIAIVKHVKTTASHLIFNIDLYSKDGIIGIELTDVAMIKTPFSITKNNSDESLGPINDNDKITKLVKEVLGAIPHEIVLANTKNARMGERELQVNILSNYERKRYNQISHERRREEYLAGVVAAKKLAQRSSSHSLGKIEIRKTELGKPLFFPPPEDPNLKHLSITHTQGIAIASTDAVPLGIDLEKIEARKKAFYRYMFSEKERAWIKENEQRATLLWTAKEAFLKAVGMGLRIHPRQIEILPSQHAPPNELELNLKPEDLVSRIKIPKNSIIKILGKANDEYAFSLCRIIIPDPHNAEKELSR